MANHFAVIIGLISLLVLARGIWSAIYNVWLSPLAHFPGPVTWSMTLIPYYNSLLRGNIYRDALRLHQKYGPVVRIGPNDLSYANETAWKDVWAHRQGHGEFRKTQIPTPVNGVQSIISADRHNHSRYRRLLSHAFSAQGLQEQEPRIKEYIDALMRGLSSHGQKGNVDVVAWFNWATFDLTAYCWLAHSGTVGDLAFGDSFGCLESARTHPWVSRIFSGISAIVFINAIKAYGLTFLLPLLVPKKMMEGRMESYKYASEKIRERVRMGSTRGDFFDKVLEKSEKEGGMTAKELESNASFLVLAGSETTATMLSGAVFLLLSNPAIMEKLVRDLRATFEREEDITIRSSSEHQYLLAVLNESMRLYTPVPTFSARSVPHPGDTVGGEYLPGGTNVHFVHHAAYRLESNFTRATEFLPQRWMGDAEFKSDNKSVFQPFSAGPRNCIGKNLAYAEMRLILARLLWRFDLSRPGGLPEWHNWADEQKTFILWDKSTLMVSVKGRAE